MEKKKIGPTVWTFPMPVVLVGTTIKGRANFMAAAWCQIACLQPEAISFALRKSRHTLEGINKNGVFSINIPSVDLTQKVDFCGLHSGSNTDKSKIFEVFYGDLENVPLIKECPLNLECKVINTMSIGTHELVVGEIIQSHALESMLDDKGKPSPAKNNALLYCPSNSYYALGDYVGQAFHIGKSLDATEVYV